MQFKNYIPNFITLGNLFFGTIATIVAVQGEYELTALFVSLGIFLDFFDGFAARIFKVSGDLGKQLDSLADMVTSGVVPGIVMFHLLDNTANKSMDFNNLLEVSSFIQFVGLILTLGACFRLAKFNIDARQSESFIGLPTPAMSLFVVFLPLVQIHSEIDFIKNLISNHYFLTIITVILTYLMNAPIHLLSLKFKNYKVRENSYKYVLIFLSVILITFLRELSIPLIIISYILLSIIKKYL